MLEQWDSAPEVFLIMQPCEDPAGQHAVKLAHVALAWNLLPHEQATGLDLPNADEFARAIGRLQWAG